MLCDELENILDEMGNAQTATCIAEQCEEAEMTELQSAAEAVLSLASNPGVSNRQGTAPENSGVSVVGRLLRLLRKSTDPVVGASRASKRWQSDATTFIAMNICYDASSDCGSLHT